MWYAAAAASQAQLHCGSQRGRIEAMLCTPLPLPHECRLHGHRQFGVDHCTGEQ